MYSAFMTLAATVRSLSLLAVLALVQSPIGCATAAKAPAASKAPAVASGVPEAAARLTGSFSSEAQSKADPEFFDVRLHMTPIWASRTDGPWLYVESFIYELPNAAARVGAWRDPARFDADTPESLVPRAGCSIVLNRAGDLWVGSTNERDCESSLRGASYATSEVTLRADGLDSWDRGFDADGKQVWGAKKGPYQFRRNQ